MLITVQVSLGMIQYARFIVHSKANIYVVVSIVYCTAPRTEKNNGLMLLLVLAYPGSAGQRAIKQLLYLVTV